MHCVGVSATAGAILLRARVEEAHTRCNRTAPPGLRYGREEGGRECIQIGGGRDYIHTHVHVHACLGYGRGTCMYIHVVRVT